MSHDRIGQETKDLLKTVEFTKLTHEHLHPNNQEKIRNHLAEEVMNSEMLNLMQVFKFSLGDKGSELDGVLELLQHSSTLIKIFRDRRPVVAQSDPRLVDLKQACDWFHDWKVSADNSKSKDRYKSIMSLQCHEDIQASGIGFIQLCNYVLKLIPHAAITPAFVNSDVVENHFNQQRSTYHGANTNPTAQHYCQAQNSIIVGQGAVSKKANAVRGKENTMPCGILLNKSLRPVKRKNEPMQNSIWLI